MGTGAFLKQATFKLNKVMKQFVQYLFLVGVQFLMFSNLFSQERTGLNSKEKYALDLSGEWRFQVDSLDEGISQKWFEKKLNDKILLPGSMTTNGKGNAISVNTPWTGQIVDSSWFFQPQYAEYRKAGNIKVPFWLQPTRYYKGAAWYQKKVEIPSSFRGKNIELFIERSHWETKLWVDGNYVGMQNSLATAHVFDLTKFLSPGTHTISICVDNRTKEINVGQNSHSISDHTQSNWNGMIGQLYISAKPQVFLGDVQLYPDIDKKQLVAHVHILNTSGKTMKANLQLLATNGRSTIEKLPIVSKQIEVAGDGMDVEIIYPMGKAPTLWDEFHPNLYSLKISLNANGNEEQQRMAFGMRKFSSKGTQFTINDRTTFLRGTLECAIFPLTGYPPTDVSAWLRIFKKTRSYGLNHVRFHSWCPPEAAFIAADSLGFYLQIECSSWANQGATIGNGEPLDKFIYEESNHIVQAYGNHPSFCMMVYGNEPAGKNFKEYLTGFVKYWQKKDARRLYTTGAGWPIEMESDYNSSPDARIQRWGEGLKSIINGEPPKSNYDWSAIISKWQHPTVSHEIGQWCVYPDFKEIKKYTGILKAKNFQIFSDKLKSHGLSKLADSFLLASGKLQVLCYKADIEAALRTPGFGGFQLLDIHDFPGQGTALVGVLNPFWGDKGYVTGKEYSRFCNAVVPLARLSKMIYQNNEELSVPVEIANFGEAVLENITPSWTIKNVSCKVLFSGNLAQTNIPMGNGIQLGEIRQSLSAIKEALMVTLTITTGKNQNSWELFVYPAVLPAVDGIFVTQQIDDKAIEILSTGGKVLLILKKGSLAPEMGGDIKIGFSSIFWNTAWTGGQPPTTLGVLVDPQHAAFKYFPTQYYSNWQWWDAMSHSNAIALDKVAKGLKPLVRVIDDWVTARSLGLVFECRVGKGKLIVSGIDLMQDNNQRPEAKQLLFSLKKYMATPAFKPQMQIDIEKIKGLVK